MLMSIHASHTHTNAETYVLIEIYKSLEQSIWDTDYIKQQR